MKDGFIRCAAATTQIKVADCSFNKEEIIKSAKIATENGAKLIVFPELCITGYTCGDLFLQQSLLKGAENALFDIALSSKDFDSLLIVGLPIAFGSSIYNCAAVLYKGDILGIVPKQNIPNYSEFYESRYFTSFNGYKEIIIKGKNFPFGNMIFACKNLEDFKIGVEICEDLWVPSPPSEKLASLGATIIANLSASDETVSKADYRRMLVRTQSTKLFCTYIYSDAGEGESSTDMVFAGHNIIAEKGTILEQSKRFETGIIYADTDVNLLMAERRRANNFTSPETDIKTVYFDMPLSETKLKRVIKKKPFIPNDENKLEERCEEILKIQSSGLATRLKHINCKNVVLGLSGGLDSTLALIVCVKAFDKLGIDKKGIKTLSMPCFGTTKRTKNNAEQLAIAYGTDYKEINIEKAVLQHFKDIGQDENCFDVTYENSQARERTQVLMDYANKIGGLVIGTGDLSELALGFATYNGDHMSMYAVNSSVPKTLVKHIVCYEANKSEGKLKEALSDIVNTPVSPELLPPTDGEISQKTEGIIGPYELHDFFLYYFVRFGYPKNKILRIAKIAFEGVYDEETITHWLEMFIKRFFTQQFKRSCLPDGPKVGSVSLSPRSDFRMPSDASYELFI